MTTRAVQDLLGREPVRPAAWAGTHRQELLEQLSRPSRSSTA
ncbi:hypothetical protein ACFV0T_38995 [Streptomyces sp. NPDC059582]